MELQQSVWDFSTPSMEQIDLQSLSSSDDNDVQRALDLFDLPKAPSLLNCDADNVSLDSFRPRSSDDTTETDNPSRRVRRDASLAQKQASNREHQRRFRMRSKVRAVRWHLLFLSEMCPTGQAKHPNHFSAKRAI